MAQGDAASDSAGNEVPPKDVSNVQEKKSDNPKGSNENANHQFVENSAESSNMKHLSSLTEKYADTDAIEELDKEITQNYDVEEVLTKQETHDLYCPKCKSCITKRVILKKRKRSTGQSSNEPKRERFDTPIHGGFDSNSPDEANVSGTATESGREPEIFRCLSCLSFFIPTGRGFKLFRCFGDGETEEEILRTSAEETPGKTKWLFSCFGQNKEKPVQVQGEARPNQSKSDGLDKRNLESENIPPSDDGAMAGNIEKKNDMNVMAVASEGEKPDDRMANNYANGVRPSDFVPPEPESNDAKSSVNTELNPPFQSGSYGVGTVTKPSVSTGFVLTPMKPEIQNESYGVGTSTKPSVSTGLVLTPMKPGIFEWEKPAIDRPLEDVESGTRPSQSETPENEARRGFGIEILKSMVYGGLVQCITSLGVVSSAAGSGASTLNILALGLANLASGLIVIGHSLRDLKNEKTKSATTHLEDQENTELTTTLLEDREDRYQELLGSRENFCIHAFISVLSFILFGLIPPLVYAFSFHKSDDKNYKLISVFAASLFCIILLAVGKVCVMKPPKSYIKTVMYYASIGITSSGISYVVGDLIGEFLERIGWFEPNQFGLLSGLQASHWNQD